ncbi:MAG: patatin-like phospholipase family protein [Gammaproteobacteria bacterium]|nr:MAG: patatin-like phospholipase family protein [Gammaproteobacteria bacterium]
MPEINKPPSLSRRQFLWLAAGSVALACTGCARLRGEPRIGLALGGGGAKGLAHILMLESLDEQGIRPHMIAGTSIGAIIGALYAAGLSGKDIRALIEQFLVAEKGADSLLPGLPKSIRWLDFIDPELGSGGLLDSSDFIEFVGEQLPVQRFRKLMIPLKVVTAELLTGKQVVIESGPILSALQASMAVPGVFRPVELGGRELVDGGVANPLPYDLLLDECDIVVAIDVSGDRVLEDGKALSSMGVLLHSFHTMSNNIVAEKLKQQRPDIYIRPEIRNVRVLEFYKAKQVFDQSQPAQRQLRKSLKRATRAYDGRWGCSTG